MVRLQAAQQRATRWRRRRQTERTSHHICDDGLRSFAGRPARLPRTRTHTRRAWISSADSVPPPNPARQATTSDTSQ